MYNIYIYIYIYIYILYRLASGLLELQMKQQQVFISIPVLLDTVGVSMNHLLEITYAQTSILTVIQTCSAHKGEEV